MDAETLKALDASIEHWGEIVAADKPSDVEIGADACALCDKFNVWEWSDPRACRGCPVFSVTGRESCRDTPFGDALTTFLLWERGDGSKLAFINAAQAELSFLKALRPIGV